MRPSETFRRLHYQISAERGSSYLPSIRQRPLSNVRKDQKDERLVREQLKVNDFPSPYFTLKWTRNKQKLDASRTLTEGKRPARNNGVPVSKKSMLCLTCNPVSRVQGILQEAIDLLDGRLIA
jgi:hypothetical protein